MPCTSVKSTAIGLGN